MNTTTNSTRGMIITIRQHSEYQNPNNHEEHNEPHSEAHTGKGDQTMMIPIHDGKQDLMISSDLYSFTLCEKRTREGVVIWEATKWFTNLDVLCGHLLRSKLRNSDAQSITELSADLERAKQELSDLWTCDPAKIMPRRAA